MAQYRDPYTDQQSGTHNHQYGDGPQYNQYDTSQTHQPYDQHGYDPYAANEYRDDPNANPQETGAPYVQETQDPNGHHHTGFAKEMEPQPQGFNSWRRYEQHDGLWTRGSRASCIGRFCCCTLMITVFLIISIILALLMWVRPPDVIVGTVGTSTTETPVQVGTNSIAVNLGVGINVTNPNYFGVSFKSISAQAFYPINNTFVGSGNESDITFHSHSETNFTFPFTLDFSTDMSSSSAILSDLATKCGVGGGAVQDITINLDITLGLRILFFVVYPTVNIPASFLCPISASDITGLIPSLVSGLP